MYCMSASSLIQPCNNLMKRLITTPYIYADYPTIVNFGALHDSLIRDRIGIGTRDPWASERLLRERPVPDFEKVISSMRPDQVSREHKHAISGNNEGRQVDYMDKQQKHKVTTKT